MVYVQQYTKDELKLAVQDVIIGFVVEYATEISLIALLVIMGIVIKNVDKIMSMFNKLFQ